MLTLAKIESVRLLRSSAGILMPRLASQTEKWCNTDKTTPDNTRIGDDIKETYILQTSNMEKR